MYTSDTFSSYILIKKTKEIKTTKYSVFVKLFNIN